MGLLLVLVGLGCVRPVPVVASPAPVMDAAGAQARQFALRSEVALAEGDSAEAARWATWLVRVDGSAPAALHAADVLRRAGAFDRAEQAAVAAITAGGGAEAHRMLGWVRLERGDPAGAARALALAGELPGVREARVTAAVGVGDPEQAAALLDGWDPATPDERLGWARAALRAGRAAAARDGAAELVADPALGPDALEIAVRAGAAACDPRPVHALAAAHPGLTADPRWRDGWTALAALTGDEALADAVVARSGDRIGAIRALVRDGDAAGALALVRDDDPAPVRALVLRAAGRGAEADVVLSSASDPASVAAWADGRLAAGDPEGALAHTAAADRADPTIAWVEAGALVLLGRVDEAAARVVDTAEGEADAAVREAAVRSLAGDDEGAARLLTDALAATPPGDCPVELWLAAADRAADCDAAALLRAALAVRLADPALSAAAAGAQERCAALRGP